MKLKNHLLGASGSVSVATAEDMIAEAINNIVLNVGVTLYGTQTDIHDPQCIINMRLALWFAAISYDNKAGKMRMVNRYISDCTIDTNSKIFDKNGTEILVANIGDVLKTIGDAVDAIKLTNKGKQ